MSATDHMDEIIIRLSKDGKITGCQSRSIRENVSKEGHVSASYLDPKTISVEEVISIINQTLTKQTKED